MKEITEDFERKAFNLKTYRLRGLLFHTQSFDIVDSTGDLVLKAKPPSIVGSGTSIFTRQGKEIVSCRNKISFKDAYISGIYRYEVIDIPASEYIGGLNGIRNKKSPEGVEWQILDPHMSQIGHIEEEITPPNVRFGGKPTYDVMTGFFRDKKAFIFKVNINSFRFQMSADFTMDGSGIFDRKLGLALAALFATMKRAPGTS